MLSGYSRFFADDAPVNDQLRHYWGRPATRQWVARDIVAQSLTMEATTVIEHYGHFIVIANVRGKFDMMVYEIRSCTPFTLRFTVTGLFSSSFFATDTTFENGRTAVATTFPA